MAKRIRRTELSDDWKKRIGAGKLMDRLLKHVNGTIELSSTQIRAADILLGKIVPDLSVSTSQNLNIVATKNLTPEEEKATLDAIMLYQLKRKGD